MYHLELIRQFENARQTRGQLSVIDPLWSSLPVDQFCCLEPPWLDNEPFYSCIPKGWWKFIRFHSPNYKRDVLLLGVVPGRTWVEIHGGNFARDTRGCILPGLRFKDIDKDGYADVLHSRKAVDAILKYFEKDKTYWMKIS